MTWNYITNWDFIENQIVVQHKEQMNTIITSEKQEGKNTSSLFIYF